jgi:CDP-diacylglycerol--glycerol-3-phosphate 3-phosphatidyltransferase
MFQRLGPHAANVLTAGRVLLTPVFVALICAAPTTRALGWAAVLVFAAIAASDVVDGQLARRWSAASVTGRTFDHLADIGFILAALWTYARLGLAPWWVPTAIATSFGFYVIDSWSRPLARGSLVGSRVGHVGGVCNYVLIGVLVCNDSAGIQALSDATVHFLFCLVPVYSGLAMATRLGARSDPTMAAGLIPDTDWAVRAPPPPRGGRRGSPRC